MMEQQRNREEVVNTQLAILISRLGVTADAETIHVHGRHRPDVLFVFGRRVITQGAWMQMKQPAWQGMPVLNVRGLSAQQLKELASRYDELSSEGLDALAKVKTDEVRCEIDAVIGRVIAIPDCLSVRELLEREPGFSAMDISSRSTMADDSKEEE
jgi:hypothetical protein